MTSVASSPQWAGWSPSVTNTRLQPASAAGLTSADVPTLRLRWAFGFPDATSAWSQPTVAGGRVFVGSQNGTVYALDAKTGCVRWVFTAQGGVRTAPTFGSRDLAGYTPFFGDTGANVYAVDAERGVPLWSRSVNPHPFARVTGSPTFFGNRLFVPLSSLEETAASQPGYGCCSFRGSLMALDATTGAVLWQTHTVPPAEPMGTNAAGTTRYGPSGVGIWSAPTIDATRDVVYVGTGNTYSGTSAAPLSDAIVALDPATGAIRWSRHLTERDVFGCRAGSSNCLEKVGPDFDFGTPPMLTTLPTGRDVIVVAQKSGWVYGLDPDREALDANGRGHLGIRHEPTVHDGERCVRHRGIHPRSGTDRRRWHAVPELGLRRSHGPRRQRPARVRLPLMPRDPARRCARPSARVCVVPPRGRLNR